MIDSSSKPVYLIFWSTNDHIEQYFMKGGYLIPSNDIEPIFIYTGFKNIREWRYSLWTTDLMYYQNYYLPELYQQVLDEVEIVIPSYRIIKLDQQVESSAKPIY